MPRLLKAETKSKKSKKKINELDKKDELNKEGAQNATEAPAKRKKPQDEMTVLDFIKTEFFKKNPDADENSAGGAFFKADLSNVDAEDQNEYFNIMKNMFTELNISKPKMQIDDFADEYYELLEMATEMAVCGCVPAMDYLCFIYKKGVDDVLPINLTRAHEWGMLAIAAGSKMSPERLRMFLDPVYKYVIEQDAVDTIIKKHKIKDNDELIDFIAYSFANIFNEKQKINLEYMSKKPIITTESFQVFLKNASKIRDEALPIMLKYIV